MKNINELELEFQEKLKGLLREYRIKRNLSQFDVANAVGKSLDTYQRWEYTGKGLTNIFILLSVFQTLDFSITEIIDILGLPPLTLSEIKAIYQDEGTLKSIKENGICSAIRENCRHMEDFTWERLLVILLKEHSKRLESRHGNP